MKKSLIIASILLVVIGYPISKRFISSDSVKLVNIEEVTTHKIKASILASGQLIHEQQVKLSAEVIGKVSKLFVKEGDMVKKGQQVLQIDDESFIANVEQQKAVVNQQKVAIERQELVVTNLEHQWKRKSKLHDKNLLDQDSFEAISHAYQVSKVDLRGALEQLKQVEARLEQSIDQLSKTKVLSPIDGQITSLDIKQGETAISGTTNISGSSLMTIADPNSMLAEINVDEADIANIKLGQKAEVISISYANQPITATVESIASSAKRSPGRQSLSFAVKLKLLDTQSINLRPGMSCRAEVFVQDEQLTLSVPLVALQIKEDNDQDTVKNYVFIIVEGKAKKTFVEVGISDDAHQEIIKGLKLGDNIVTGPDKILRHLKDAEAIAPLEPETASGSTIASENNNNNMDN